MSAESTVLWTVGLTLLPFVVSTSVTPGPNNLMVTASALNFGVRRTLPHMAGIIVGFPLMLVAVGTGLKRVFEQYPLLHQILTFAGAAYLIFLAWKIATSAPATDGLGSPRQRCSITFFQAVMFQWVNPKAWIMALGAVTTYTTAKASFLAQILVMAGVFAVVAVPNLALWAFFGRSLTRAIRSPRSLRVFNYAMAALLIASLALLWLD